MLPILMYHQVAEIPRKLDPHGLAVSPTRFEQQMSYLARNGYSCIGLPEAVYSLQRGGKVPARSFVLTFDDGYQDFYSHACPILERFGFTATIFLVAGCMGSMSNWWGQDGARSGRLLSWDDAQELVMRGYTIGSHSISHPFLNSLDDQSACTQIQISKALLKERLGTQVEFFSYPFSDGDSRIEGLVKAAGYTAACAGNDGPWNIFHLWRVPCRQYDTSLTFTLKVSGWYGRQIAIRESVPGLFTRRVGRIFKHWVHIKRSSRRVSKNHSTN